MLLDKEIKIVLNRGNLGFYNKLMNNKYKVGDEIILPIDLLPKTYKGYVTVACDICKVVNDVKYKNYNDCLGYGFYSCMKCKHIKRRMTNLEKYGDESYHNVDKLKSTMIEKYGFYNNNREKCKETCIEKYGVDNVSKSDIVKETKRETNIKNWGVENVFQSEEIKDKIKDTNLMLYGVIHNSQSDIIKIKKVKTCNKKFGVDYPTQSDIIMDKIKSNNIIKYGTTSYTKTGEYKELVNKTNNEKYGKDWYMSTDDFKIKSKITNNEKYGVDYPSQNFEIFQKQQISGFNASKYNNLYYRGTYELDFLKFCENSNIKVENGPTVVYVINNISRKYFSDFYLPKYNLICEIKSKYYFDKYKDINLMKRNTTISNGYNFIFIIDKNYSELLSLIF